MKLEMDTWFLCKQKKKGRKIEYRLFLFPPAGGDVSTYLHWEDLLPDFVEVCFIKLPGRGMRISEPAIDNLDELTEKLLAEIEKYIDLPFVFFGHSMGGLVAYGLAQKMQERNMKLPKKLIISSIKAPSYMNKFTESLTDDNDDKLYKKSDEEFLSRVEKLGGIPQILLDSKEFLELILPAFKRDMKLCETYNPANAKVLDIPFEIFGGNKDEIVNKEELNGWKRFTNRGCAVTIFPGNHFYFLNNPTTLLFQISNIFHDLYFKIE